MKELAFFHGDLLAGGSGETVASHLDDDAENEGKQKVVIIKNSTMDPMARQIGTGEIGMGENAIDSR
ncbi:MAG: hypothetical protein MUC57_12985 [Desulfobacterales bacterium]|nr:hypothetical protein [Desulfobacterales bacterium]